MQILKNYEILNSIPFLYFLEPYLLLISSLKDFALFGNLTISVDIEQKCDANPLKSEPLLIQPKT
ncbi:hypothetical protein BpHYR1_007060 [Brachionus plicatilis]|uniref:Uncharacterized protein n=1 Tax=Brachionus plicatilis TaxID=10195 RepID=A0A3M7PBR7_BRAPC|nr:hypothetical protein BpHYR1_007060 [Brachionus plicatilis]